MTVMDLLRARKAQLEDELEEVDLIIGRMNASTHLRDAVEMVHRLDALTKAEHPSAH